MMLSIVSRPDWLTQRRPACRAAQASRASRRRRRRELVERMERALAALEDEGEGVRELRRELRAALRRIAPNCACLEDGRDFSSGGDLAAARPLREFGPVCRRRRCFIGSTGLMSIPVDLVERRRRSVVGAAWARLPWCREACTPQFCGYQFGGVKCKSPARAARNLLREREERGAPSDSWATFTWRPPSQSAPAPHSCAAPSTRGRPQRRPSRA